LQHRDVANEIALVPDCEFLFDAIALFDYLYLAAQDNRQPHVALPGFEQHTATLDGSAPCQWFKQRKLRARPDLLHPFRSSRGVEGRPLRYLFPSNCDRAAEVAGMSMFVSCRGNQSPLSIRQRLHLDSSTASFRLVARRRSPGARWRAHVWWRADSANCRSTVLSHMSGTFADAPSSRPFLRTLCIRDVAAV